MERHSEATAEARLAALVQSSGDAIVAKNLDGIITDWNPAAERLFGYSAAEAIGRHITLLAPPGGEAEMAEVIARIKRGERLEHYETTRRRKDGAILEISLTVSPIFAQDGRIIGASKIARDISDRRLQEQRLKLLMSELDHRAKNVLAVAQAMLRLTRAESLPEFINAVEGRIRALSRVHSQVAENRWDGAELRSLLAGCLEVFGDASARANLDGPPLWLSPAAAQVVGVLVHELTTNAVKHGALSAPEGAIHAAWWLDSAGDLHLSWTERGGPSVSTPSRRSFGTQVIERNVPDQLGGSAEIAWKLTGLQCEFVIPAANVVSREQRAMDKNVAAPRGPLALPAEGNAGRTGSL